jgi:hypothetical protein
MFKKLLRDQTFSDVVECNYLVTRILRHLRVAPVEQLLKAVIRHENPTAGQIKLIKEMIRAMEEKEKMPLDDFDDARCSRYSNLLYKTTSARARSDLNIDLTNGKRLLKELRTISPWKQAKV